MMPRWMPFVASGRLDEVRLRAWVAGTAMGVPAPSRNSNGRIQSRRRLLRGELPDSRTGVDADMGLLLTVQGGYVRSKDTSEPIARAGRLDLLRMSNDSRYRRPAATRSPDRARQYGCREYNGKARQLQYERYVSGGVSKRCCETMRLRSNRRGSVRACIAGVAESQSCCNAAGQSLPGTRGLLPLGEPWTRRPTMRDRPSPAARISRPRARPGCPAPAVPLAAR